MFKFRSFTSLLISFSFLIMTYTGIMLFIVPQGKIAYWTNWELFGLSKTQYGNLHVTFMVLFLVGMFFHIFLNWSLLIKYLKNKEHKISFLTKEFLLAFLLSATFIIGTLYQKAPFSTFLDLQDDIKESWVNENTIPPYGHAELSSLKSLCKKSYINLEKAIRTLEKNGIKGVKANKQIGLIAKENNLAPSDIYNMIDIEENEL